MRKKKRGKKGCGRTREEGLNAGPGYLFFFRERRTVTESREKRRARNLRKKKKRGGKKRRAPTKPNVIPSSDVRYDDKKKKSQP